MWLYVLKQKKGTQIFGDRCVKHSPRRKKPLQTGVKNIEAKVITNREEKKHVILKHFAHRMRKRPVKEDVKYKIYLNEKVI